MAEFENYFGRIGRDFQKIWPNFVSDSWEHWAQLNSSFAKSKTNENEIEDVIESKWFQLSSDILGIY